VQFKATGKFTDGSEKDETKLAVWTSSNGSVASVDPAGFAQSHSVGSATMNARVEGLGSSAQLTVSKAAIVSVAVDPSASSIALGTATQLKATGTYTDQSTRDVTSIVTWESSEPKIVVVNSTGLADSKSTGKALITATSGRANASCELTVLQAALVAVSVDQDRSTVPLGTTVQLKALGVYTDGHTRDLTSSVSWSSSPQGVVDVNASGLAIGLKLGTATVNARSGSITGTGTLTVSAALLTSIAITAGKVTMPLGTTQQMAATGTYTDHNTRDLTNSVSWSSAPGHIVSITSRGVAGAKALGTAIISATEDGISARASLTVSPPALTTISISPPNPTIPLASSLQLTTIGSFTDGSTQDLTRSVAWSVDNASILGLGSTGNATGQRVGSTDVKAAFGGILGSTTVVVEPLVATSYFIIGSNGLDSTFRITNPGGDEQKLCAMVYVFDQSQQMVECCGCRILRDGLRTLSLNKDLIGNPLTGTPPITGSVMLATADYTSNPSCNPSSITPAGMGIGWATHLQATASNANAFTEEPLSQSPLTTTLSSSLQAQCGFIQQLGNGQGSCSCGTGY